MNVIGNNYEYFLSIVELKSITKAANKNYISQPSMTQYLNRLEKAVGARLFNRNNGPLTLTCAGELYLDYIHKLVELNASWETELTKLKKVVDGTITLGIPLQMQSLLYPRVLSPFQSSNPRINIKIDDNASPALEKNILYNRLDIAMIYVKEKYHKSLSYYKLEKEPLLLICSKDNPLADGYAYTIENPHPISAKALAEETIILLSPEFIVHDYAEKLLKTIQINPSRQLTMSSINAIMYAVSENKGISLIPRYAYYSFKDTKNLAVLSLKNSSPITMNLAMVYKKTRNLTPATQKFIEYVKEVYRLPA